MKDCTCKGSCRGAAGLGVGWRCVLTGEFKRIFEPGDKVVLRFGRITGEIVERLPDRNGYEVRTRNGVFFAHESNVLSQCWTCGGSGRQMPECSCYEIAGGHQPGCCFHGMKSDEISEMAGKSWACPDCNPQPK